MLKNLFRELMFVKSFRYLDGVESPRASAGGGKPEHRL